jgi:hypothetical protein
LNSASGSASHVSSIAITIGAAIPTIQLPPLSFPQGESALDSFCLVSAIQRLGPESQNALIIANPVHLINLSLVAFVVWFLGSPVEMA